MPRILRTDRGAETVMAADAHFALSGEVRPTDDGSPLPFRATFRLVPIAQPTTDTNRLLSCYDAAGTSVTFNSRARVRSPAERIFSGERIR